jgi:hypothetical protein
MRKSVGQAPTAGEQTQQKPCRTSSDIGAELEKSYCRTRSNVGPERVKSRLNSENACHHSVRNLLSPSFPSKNIKIKIHRTIILPVLYGFETWLLTLKQKHRLMGFENRMLKRILGLKTYEVTGEWSKLHTEFNDPYCSPI